jgi:hypothetical protein
VSDNSSNTPAGRISILNISQDEILDFINKYSVSHMRTYWRSLFLIAQMRFGILGYGFFGPNR